MPQTPTVAEPQQDPLRAQRSGTQPSIARRRDQRGALPGAVLEQPLRAERRVVDAGEVAGAVDERVEPAGQLARREPALPRPVALRDGESEAAGAERRDPPTAVSSP